MDQADPQDGPAPDRYLLQFSPAAPTAAPALDAILRQTSNRAASWYEAWGGNRGVS